MSIIAQLKDLFGHRERTPSDIELSDMGLSRAAYRRLISSTAGTRARMEVLAAQFGVTPAMIDADRGLTLELAETCGHCQYAKACQNTIDLGVDFNTSRCPNAPLYKEMSLT